VPADVVVQSLVLPNAVSPTQSNGNGWRSTIVADHTILGVRIVLTRLDYRFNQTFVIAGAPERDTSRVVGMIDTYSDIIIMRSAPRKEQLIAGKLLRQYKREMAMFK